MKKNIPVSKTTKSALPPSALTKKGQSPQSPVSPLSDKAHKPVVMPFTKPVFTNPFAKGSFIRQQNKGKFFARTRRGSI